jgi:hypothetical protein
MERIDNADGMYVSISGFGARSWEVSGFIGFLDGPQPTLQLGNRNHFPCCRHNNTSNMRRPVDQYAVPLYRHRKPMQ